jgi:uncharacterized membrane protein/uncharacterized protein YegL
MLSLAAHITVAVLCVGMLAGMTFHTERRDNGNNVILLVDVSDSMEPLKGERDNFIKAVFDAEGGGDCNIGVVAYANGHVYSVRLGPDSNYNDYAAAPANKKPDASATNIGEALIYAQSRLTDRGRGRIVLLTDGLENEGNVLAAARSVAQDGVRIDVKYFERPKYDGEIQIVGVEMPDAARRGEPMQIKVTVQNSAAGKNARLELYDKTDRGAGFFSTDAQGGATLTPDKKLFSGSQNYLLGGGIETLIFEYRATAGVFHELLFAARLDGDTIENNNFYFAFFTNGERNLLILTGQGQNAGNLREAASGFDNVDVRNAADAPLTVAGLREYDEIVLMNLSRADLSGVKELETNIQVYVRDFGGSLLVSGGDNAFKEADMKETAFEEMLPVKSATAAAPVALTLVMDISGSMRDNYVNGRQRMAVAKDGAIAALDALGDNDYVSLITFGGGAWAEWPLMPASRKNEKFNRLNPKTGVLEYKDMYEIVRGIETVTGTHYDAALQETVNVFSAFPASDVKKHVIFLTDGGPTQGYEQTYRRDIQYLREQGVTTSAIAISLEEGGGSVAASSARIQEIAALGGGRARLLLSNADILTLPSVMADETRTVKNAEINYETFTPAIRDHSFATAVPQLSGYNGSILKEGARQVLYKVNTDKADEPIYAVWQYGGGRVGSFLSDLSGDWSADYFTDPNGVQFIRSALDDLSPPVYGGAAYADENIEFTYGNYIASFRISSPSQTSDTLEVTVTDPNGDQYQASVKRQSRDSFFVTFETYALGVYDIQIVKKDASGAIVALNADRTKDVTVVKSVFSYSAEYDAFPAGTVDENREFLVRLAQIGNGKAFESPYGIFEQEIVKTDFDPRLPFLIASMILLLFDIVCRKFKFKRGNPHGQNPAAPPQPKQKKKARAFRVL